MSLGADTFLWGTRTFVMAIINATADSFSGDGIDGRAQNARLLASTFAEAGADVIDVGGESTRPGAALVPDGAQLARVIPIIEAISDSVDTPISIDTSSLQVAQAAVDAGARVLNDVLGFRNEPELADFAAERKLPAVLMHNQRGRPHTDVIDDISRGFDESLQICTDAGLDHSLVILDPGFGFGFNADQNLEMLRRLPELWRYRLPLVIGTSRKSTIGAVIDAEVDQRLFGTAATVTQSICAGVDMIRVHDVAEMVDAARMTDAVVR
jgi:dihydropteroate synthase